MACNSLRNVNVVVFFNKVYDNFLSGDIKELKSKSFIIQEGCQYQLKIYFYVQREIVTGLKYVQQSYRAGIQGMLIGSCNYVFILLVFFEVLC
jgi:hypothetical protein